jgi:hypothetical protein
MNVIVGVIFSRFEAMVAMMMVEHGLFFLDQHLPEDTIFGLVAVGLLTFCLYGVSFFYRQLPPSPFSPA